MANKRRLTIEIVGDEKSALGAFDRTEKGASGLTGKLKKIGAGLAKVGAAAGIAVGAAVAKGLSDAMDIEAANDRLAAQLGLSEEMAEKAGDAAGRLYGNAYGESFEEVSGAVGAVIAGLGDLLPEDKIEDTTAKVLDLASAFEVDVNDAVSTTSVLISSGLARDADHAFDLITSGMQEVPAAMRGELFPVLEEYAQSFGALGITGEDAMGLLVQASHSGRIELDKVGDALKELTIRSTDMSSASVEAFRAAGLNADEMAARFLEGGDSARGALDDLVDGLLGMDDPVERSNAAIALFGTPLEDLGTAEIPEFLNGLDSMWSSMGDVEGAAESMGDTLNNNLKTKLESVRRKAMMKLAEVVGNVLIPAFERLSEAFGRGGLAGAFSELGKMFDSLSPKLKAITAGFAALAVAVWAATGPVSLIIAGVAAAAAGLVVLEQRTGVFSRALDAIQPHLEGVRRTFQSVFEGIRATFEVVTTVITAAWDRFGNHLLAHLQTRLNNIMQVVQGVLTTIEGVVDVFVGIITLDFSKAWDGIKKIFSGALNVIVGAVKEAINSVSLIIGGTMAAISLVWSGIWEGMKRSATAVWDGMKRAWSSTLGALKTAVTAPLNGIKTAVTTVFDGIRVAAGSVFDGLSSGFKGAVNAVLRGLETGLNGAIRGMNKALDAADKAAGPLVNFPAIPTVDLPRLDRGTRNFPGGLALYGEEGPELGVIPRGTDVYSHRETRRILENLAAHGGGPRGPRTRRHHDGVPLSTKPPTVNVHVTVNGSVVGEGGMRQLSEELGSHIHQVIRRMETANS